MMLKDLTLHICVGKAWGLKTTLPQTPHSAGSLRHWVRLMLRVIDAKTILSLLQATNLFWLAAVSNNLLTSSLLP